MIADIDIKEDTGGWETVVGAHDLWLRRRVRDGMRRLGLRPRQDQVVESVQEVYCRLLQGGPPRLRRLRGIRRRSVLTYLGRVADSVLLDEMRAARALKRGGAPRTHPARKLIRLEEQETDPEALLLQSERRRMLIRYLLAVGEVEGFSRRDARILWLAVVEGWRSRDLARAFKLKPRYVDTLLHRVRQRLIRQWGRPGAELRRRT